MEGDKAVENEKELTSTNTTNSSNSSDMEELLSSTKEKSDSSTNDTLPTSSTDASTSIKSLHLVSDDPISSTSSEMDFGKSNVNNSTNIVEKTSNFDTEAELLEISIGVQASGKIEENVDDLVNDLETLLGESTDSFTTSVKSAEVIEENIVENEKCEVDVQQELHGVTEEIMNSASGDADLQEPGSLQGSREPASTDDNNDNVEEKINSQGKNCQQIVETFASVEQQKTVERTKPIPEINIRRKTVEQDLEKVVCLSEESSDSDTNGTVSGSFKQPENDSSNNEETDLIQIAQAADQLAVPEVPEEDVQIAEAVDQSAVPGVPEESIPVIDDFVSLQPEAVSSVVSADSGSNLETILAVASLENESVSDIRVERRLSEKEIQEMEAIRMAVASITDSSQDTYDSFLVDNSVAIDNSAHEVSENVQEFPTASQEVITMPKQFDTATLVISSSTDSQVCVLTGEDDLSKEVSGNITDGEISGKALFDNDNSEPAVNTEVGDVKNSQCTEELDNRGTVDDSKLIHQENESQEITDIIGDNCAKVEEKCTDDDIVLESTDMSKEVPGGTKPSSEDCFQESVSEMDENKGDESVILHKDDSVQDSKKQKMEVVENPSDIKCSHIIQSAEDNTTSYSSVSEESKISVELELKLGQTSIEIKSDTVETLEVSSSHGVSDDTADEGSAQIMADEVVEETKENYIQIVNPEKSVDVNISAPSSHEVSDDTTEKGTTQKMADEVVEETKENYIQIVNPEKSVDVNISAPSSHEVSDDTTEEGTTQKMADEVVEETKENYVQIVSPEKPDDVNMPAPSSHEVSDNTTEEGTTQKMAEEVVEETKENYVQIVNPEKPVDVNMSAPSSHEVSDDTTEEGTTQKMASEVVEQTKENCVQIVSPEKPVDINMSISKDIAPSSQEVSDDTAEETTQKIASEVVEERKENSVQIINPEMPDVDVNKDIAEKDIFQTETVENEISDQFSGEKQEITCDESTSVTEKAVEKNEITVLGVISDENNISPCKEGDRESEVRIPENVMDTVDTTNILIKTVNMPTSVLSEHVEEKHINNVTVESLDIHEVSPDIKSSSCEDPLKENVAIIVDETKRENDLVADQKGVGMPATEAIEVQDKGVPKGEESNQVRLTASEEFCPVSDTIIEGDEMSGLGTNDPTSTIESGTKVLQEVHERDALSVVGSVIPASSRDDSPPSVEIFPNIVDSGDKNMEENASATETEDCIVRKSVKRTHDEHSTDSELANHVKLKHKETEIVEQEDTGAWIQSVDQPEGTSISDNVLSTDVLLKNEDQSTEETRRSDDIQTVDKEKSFLKNESVNEDIANSGSISLQTDEKEIIVESAHVKENTSSMVDEVADENKITSRDEVCKEDDLPKSGIITEKNKICDPKLSTEEVVLNQPVGEHGESSSEELIKEVEEVSMPEDTNSDLKKQIEENGKLETEETGSPSDHIETMKESNLDEPMESPRVSAAEVGENIEGCAYNTMDSTETQNSGEINSGLDTDYKLAAESKPSGLHETKGDNLHVSEQKDISFNTLSSPEKTKPSTEEEVLMKNVSQANDGMDINTQSADQEPKADMPVTEMVKNSPEPIQLDEEKNISGDVDLDKGNEELSDINNTNLAPDKIVEEKEKSIFVEVAVVGNISDKAVKGDTCLGDSSENEKGKKVLISDSDNELTSKCMEQAYDGNDQETVANSELPSSEEISKGEDTLKETPLVENSSEGVKVSVSEVLSKKNSSDSEQLVKENNIEAEGNMETLGPGGLNKEEREEGNNLSQTICIDNVGTGENNELPTSEEHVAEEGQEKSLSVTKGTDVPGTGEKIESASEEHNADKRQEENDVSVTKVIVVEAGENTELPVSEENITEERKEESDISVTEDIVDVDTGDNIKLTVSEEHIAEERSLRSRTRRGNKISEPLSINVEGLEKKDKVYSPKITIKPVKVPDEEVSTTSDVEGNKGSLKMTITKQSDKMRSILKVFNPEEDVESTQSQDEPIPKLIIKPKIQQVEQQHSPKMTTRSSKTYSPTNTRCSSPRVSIKPLTKPPEANPESLSPLKITFKPVVKPEEVNKKSPKALKEQEQKNVNPKITIKPIPKPSEVDKEEAAPNTPKVIIKPIKRHLEDNDAENDPERSSPKITIKPVIKLDEQDSNQLSNSSTPKLKIKPIKKQDDLETGAEKDEGSPKISIKPVVKPPEQLEEDDEEVKERIVLKINKGNLPTPTKDPKKREYPEDDKSEKVGIKLKFSTTGGHTHIVQEGEESNKRQRKDSGYSSGAAKKEVEEIPHKRSLDEKLPDKNKRLRSANTPDKIIEGNNSDNVIAKEKLNPATHPISEHLRSQYNSDFATSEDSHRESSDISKIADLASQTTHIEATSILTVGIATPSVPPAPKKRGRPRKATLEVREELKDPPTSSQAISTSRPEGASVTEAGSTPKSEGGAPKAMSSSSEGRPKRSCRGQNVIATLGIKPRKPRGGARGRGGKVNMGDRESSVVQSPSEPVQSVSMKPEKEENVSKTNLKLMQKTGREEAQKQKEETTKQKEEDGNKKSLDEEVKHLETIVKKESEEAGDSKRKRDDDEEQNPPKKKKEDKTPPRKLEVTTRRQRAQQQKGPEEAEQVEKVPEENPKLDQKTSIVNQSEGRSSIEAIPSSSGVNTAQEVVVISTDDDSCGKEESVSKLESVEVAKNSPPKSSVEQLGEKIIEQKRVELEVVKDDTAKFEVQQIDIDENKEDTNTKSEEAKIEEGKILVEEDKKEEKKVEVASAEDDSDEDSEAERRREWILMKKQEAIKKCRAKRMEKLARAAELKKKRQEQAAQQREARKAAEEAERAAAEKLRATRRYGRYGLPKPQISLIDEPVQETDGTIKSHMGLFNPEIERINITQPMLIDYDSEKSGHLKNLSSNSGLIDSSYETPLKLGRSIGAEDVVMLDEETRMSADFRGSRAQTPAKHAKLPPDAMIEDSQGSIGTEGGKSRSSKAPKMEVFQDSESTVFTADQLAEYSWNGQGPYMLQEQVAQYLGIKSFKRKYPHITRRPVDMQERDYLKENSLATEAQCDLGLTAVIAQDILDIMYTDFQDKYEEYCRAQREKQARELANKQKFLNQFTFKPGFDKLDILDQVVQSAAAWNQHLNKARREQRRAYMDLQNLTVQYPKSRVKVIPTPKIGHYPVALVPGQFTDYFKEYTPTELNNLPLNTMCYDEIKIPGMETESEESSSGSDSDSESCSGSSDSNSSCEDEDCKDCIKKIKSESNAARETDSDDVVIIENDASSSDSVVLVSVTAAPVTA